MEKDSEPQKSELPGSGDSGKLSSEGQTLGWLDVIIRDPDDDQEHLEIEEDVAKKKTLILFISHPLANVSTVSKMISRHLEILVIKDEKQFFNNVNRKIKLGRLTLQSMIAAMKTELSRKEADRILKDAKMTLNFKVEVYYNFVANRLPQRSNRVVLAREKLKGLVQDFHDIIHHYEEALKVQDTFVEADNGVQEVSEKLEAFDGKDNKTDDKQIEDPPAVSSLDRSSANATREVQSGGRVSVQERIEQIHIIKSDQKDSKTSTPCESRLSVSYNTSNDQVKQTSQVESMRQVKFSETKEDISEDREDVSILVDDQCWRNTNKESNDLAVSNVVEIKKNSDIDFEKFNQLSDVEVSASEKQEKSELYKTQMRLLECDKELPKEFEYIKDRSAKAFNAGVSWSENLDIKVKKRSRSQSKKRSKLQSKKKSRSQSRKRLRSRFRQRSQSRKRSRLRKRLKSRRKRCSQSRQWPQSRPRKRRK